MRRAIVGAAVILVALGLLAAACGGGEEEEQTPQSPAATSTPRAAASPQTTTPPAGALKVTQVNFRFQPDKLTGQAGQAITVDVENDGTFPHTFTITELNVDEEVAPGEKATVTFTLSNGGTFAYFCRFHRSSGMEGTLTVSGDSAGAAPGGLASSPSDGGGSPGYYGGY